MRLFNSASRLSNAKIALTRHCADSKPHLAARYAARNTDPCPLSYRKRCELRYRVKKIAVLEITFTFVNHNEMALTSKETCLFSPWRLSFVRSFFYFFNLFSLLENQRPILLTRGEWKYNFAKWIISRSRADFRMCISGSSETSRTSILIRTPLLCSTRGSLASRIRHTVL